MSTATQTIRLAYGKTALDLKLDPDEFDLAVLLPEDQPPLVDPEQIFIDRAANPMNASPLRELARRKGIRRPSLTIVTADHTRPVPDQLLVPWIVDALGIPDQDVTVLVGTGTHRAATDDELDRMLGKKNRKRFKVVCHDCRDDATLVTVGQTACGGTCRLNREYVNADIRLATGFIEPHFFAGFSGGAKAIVPGIAAFDTIGHFHRASLIAHPGTTWGLIAGNPLLELSRAMVALCPPDAIVNVALNSSKAITDIFVGHYIDTHDAGCRAVGTKSIVPAPRKYPVVVTTNSGYPLDMNYYQTVKGLSAAARITEPGGSIIIASECSQGLPEATAFAGILSRAEPTDHLLDEILAAATTAEDQWQAQALFQIITKFNVYLYSDMNRQQQKQTRATPIHSIEQTLDHLRKNSGIEKMPVAVLPLGPVTIPTSPQKTPAKTARRSKAASRTND
jgi:nickel-dependent lactate racemase